MTVPSCPADVEARPPLRATSRPAARLAEQQQVRHEGPLDLQRLDDPVREEGHHEDARDHDADDLPGVAERQPHLGDALGLDEHEPGAEQEVRQVAGRRPFREAHDQDQRERQHDGNHRHVGDGIRPLRHVEERPVVGRHVGTDRRIRKPRRALPKAQLLDGCPEGCCTSPLAAWKNVTEWSYRPSTHLGAWPSNAASSIRWILRPISSVMSANERTRTPCSFRRARASRNPSTV